MSLEDKQGSLLLRPIRPEEQEDRTALWIIDGSCGGSNGGGGSVSGGGECPDGRGDAGGAAAAAAAVVWWCFICFHLKVALFAECWQWCWKCGRRWQCRWRLRDARLASV